MPVDEVAPDRHRREAVERGGTEQHREHGHRSRPDRQRRQVVEGVADLDAAAVRVATKRREPRCDDAVHLERVGTAEPPVAADDRAGQGDDDVDPQPELDRAERPGVRAGELQPDEREQAERRRASSPDARDSRDRMAGSPPAAADTPCVSARSLARPARPPATPPPARPTAARRTRRAADCCPAARTTRPSPPRRRRADPPRPAPIG